MTDGSLDAILAERLTRAARAVQDLCDVLWEALHEELSDRSPNGPRAQRVADLSGRVADVSSTVAALASYTTPGVPKREPAPPAEPPTMTAPPAPPEPSSAREPAVVPVTPATTPRAVIVDELTSDGASLPAPVRPASDPPPPQQRRATREEPSTVREQPTRARPLPWDEPLPEEMRVTRRAVEGSAAPSPPRTPFREP
jgi:hypothetical protein